MALACGLLRPSAMVPDQKGDDADFEIVDKAREQSLGTVADGDAICPFPTAVA